MDGMKSGVELIADERKRQIEREGWTAEHDDKHAKGEMALAAACYSCEAYVEGHGTTLLGLNGINHWPWNLRWWKPGDRKRNLVKAGALIAAEIDRLQRSQQRGVDYWQSEEAKDRFDISHAEDK